MALEGREVDHSQFGKQFKISRVLVDAPRTLQGLTRYLACDAVKGLGPEFARRVVAHFGLDTLRIIEEEPERLVEVSGIGKKRTLEIVSHWERDRKHREIHASLRGYGIGQALANRIVEQYGNRATGVVGRDPYRLAAEVQGVGFRTADRIAMSNGIPADDPSRAEAALIHHLAGVRDQPVMGTALALEPGEAVGGIAAGQARSWRTGSTRLLAMRQRFCGTRRSGWTRRAGCYGEGGGPRTDGVHPMLETPAAPCTSRPVPVSYRQEVL